LTGVGPPGRTNPLWSATWQADGSGGLCDGVRDAERVEDDLDADTGAADSRLAASTSGPELVRPRGVGVESIAISLPERQSLRSGDIAT
jgi:hypothetical protein